MIQQLIIMVGSRPMCRCLTYGQVRAWLEQQTDDVLEMARVWRVYPDHSYQPSTDATEDFVEDWRKRIEAQTSPGLRPNYPAFIEIKMQAEQSEEVA